MAAKDAVTKEAFMKEQNAAGPAGPVKEKQEKISSGEFLGGFYRGDRLLPVITLVVLFSPDPWDGPMSIHEMLSGVEKELLPFIADYRINLIAPAAMDAASMDRFRSSLREVLLYIKYSTDKKQLRELLETDTRYQELDQDAAVVINTITNSKLKLDRKEENVNMCIAIEEMRLESRQEGERLGEKRAEKQVRQINRLNTILIDLGRFDDLKRAAQEPEYQARLMEEFSLTDN